MVADGDVPRYMGLSGSAGVLGPVGALRYAAKTPEHFLLHDYSLLSVRGLAKLF